MGTSDQWPDEQSEPDLVVKIADAKARLSELIQRAEAGERVVIARGAHAVVELRPLPVARSPIGLYQALGGTVDMDAIHAAIDEGWSEQDLDDFEGDLDVELKRP